MATRRDDATDPDREPEHEPAPSGEYRDYVIKGEQGQGGIGRVLRAHDRRLDRPVALKELLDASGDPARFLREARLTARLQHPGIVPVYEIGFRADGAPFYAMKLIEGERFDRIVARAATLDERLALLPDVLAVAEAIAYAHEHRIIHRDLKPSNVIVGAFGETVVIDWGIAKDLDESAQGAQGSTRPASDAAPARDVALGDTLLALGEIASSGQRTIAGHALGTLAYMPPEQFRGADVDERADVFALGAFLYHVLTGAAPYEGINIAELARRIDAAEPDPIESRAPGLPRELVAIARKAMAPRAADRYPTAKELAADLKRFQTGQLVSAHEYTGGEVMARWLSRHRRAVATAVLFVAALGAVGAVSVRRVVRERERAEAERARAESERARAEARAQELTLVEARLSLDRDPTASLAWLKTARFDDASWNEIASIAADAKARGVARHVVHGEGGVALDSPVIARDGARVWVARDAAGIYAWDLATGKLLRTYPTTTQVKPLDLQLTADGARVVGGTYGGEVVTIDVATDAVRSLPAHHGWSFVQRAPSGHAIASCGDDGVVRTWDLDAGRDRVLGKHDGSCRGLAFSPDGATLASYASDGQGVRLWDLKSGAARSIPAARGATDGLAWSPSGKWIVVADATHALRAWDTATLASKAFPDAASARSGAFLLDDRYYALGSDATVRVWDVATGAVRALHGHTATLENADASLDGKRFISCSEDGTARLWDVATWSSRVLKGHTGSVFGCVFSPDDATIVTAGNDATLRVWDVRDDGARAFVGHDDDLYAVAFSPDGKRVASGANDGVVRVWDAATGASFALEGHTASVERLAWIDDARLATVAWDHTARVWDVATKRALVLPTGGKLEGLAVTRDGAAIVAAGEDAIARVWDTATGRELARMVGHEKMIDYVALSPDDALVATGAQDATVRVWDRRTGAQRLVLRGHTDVLAGVVFAKGGTRVVSAGADRTVRVWDAASGALLRTMEGHRDRIRRLVVGPDDRFVATAASDHDVRIWDVDTGESLVLTGHADHVRSLAFSRDGALLASAGYDGTTRLWDARTGRLLGVARSDAPVMQAVFSPDATRIASVGWDRKVRVVPVEAIRFLPESPAALRAWLDATTSAVVVEGGKIATP